MQNKDYPSLRECPFCGGEVEEMHYCWAMVVGVITCGNCRKKFVIPCDEAKDLAQAWNRRANDGT
jgi:transcription elongation factor Elf1